MKILFDSQCFYLHGKGGISRYVANLIKALQQIDQVEVVFQSNNVFEFFANNKSYKNVSVRGFNRLKLERSKKRDLQFVQQHIAEVDWYFPTYYHPDFLKFKGESKIALLIHDMIHEKIPNETENAELHSSWKKSYINRSAIYFTVSENTKADLNDIYPITSKNSVRIYPGFFFENIKSSKIETPENYFLYVGARGKYKNFEFLLNSKIIDLFDHLICVGGGAFTKAELVRINEIGASKKMIHLSPDQSQLKYLYENANGFISTSKYEGFGLPVIEALECGTNLYLWDSKVYREITRNKAIYFDDVDSLVKEVEKGEGNSHEINKDDYNWGKTAQIVLASLINISDS